MWLRQPRTHGFADAEMGLACGRSSRPRTAVTIWSSSAEFLAVPCDRKRFLPGSDSASTRSRRFHELLRRALRTTARFAGSVRTTVKPFSRANASACERLRRSAASLEELRAAQMALLARRLRAERLDEILLFLGRCIGRSSRVTCSFSFGSTAPIARASSRSRRSLPARTT